MEVDGGEVVQHPGSFGMGAKTNANLKGFLAHADGFRQLAAFSVAFAKGAAEASSVKFVGVETGLHDGGF